MAYVCEHEAFDFTVGGLVAFLRLPVSRPKHVAQPRSDFPFGAGIDMGGMNPDTDFMQSNLSFGEYLRRRRREKRMPLQDVARQAGVSTTHLSRLENDNGLPTTDTVVKIHNVLGGDLPVMLELAKCLPDEILDRYIRHADDTAPALKRSTPGQADNSLFAAAFIEDMDPDIRRAITQAFNLSERDAEGIVTALRRLAKLSEQEREQVIGVLKLATRGVDG